jgi:hypothetical protein
LVDFYTRIVGLGESDRVHDKEGGLRTSFMQSGHEHHSLAVFLAAKTVWIIIVTKPAIGT